MKRALVLLSFAALMGIMFSSCSLHSKSMKTPAHHVEFVKGDFEYSDQLTGEAVEQRIIGIDWARLFKKELGEVIEPTALNIPIIGTLIANKVNLYALYNVMQENPGYDVVFFPQFETKKFGLWPFYQETRVKVTTRLGKITK